MKKDITNNTKNKYLIFLKVFSDFLIYKKIITVNFAREKKKPKVQMQLPCALSKDDIITIYNAIYRKWAGSSLLIRNTLIFETFIYT